MGYWDEEPKPLDYKNKYLFPEEEICCKVHMLP